MNGIKISAESLQMFKGLAVADDADFAGCGNPYGLECEDVQEINLNGIYGSYNHIAVEISGDRTETPAIVITAKESGKRVQICGEDAQKVLNRINDDKGYYGVSYAIYLNTYKFVL